VTVTELQAALQAALDRGLPPETTVVIELDHNFEFCVAKLLGDPSEEDAGCDMWFTLSYGEVADCRSTPGGMP
jgi:hypothetical protein